MASIRAIAVRTAKRGAMREVGRATARAQAGIDGDLPVSRRRGITFISAEQWSDTLAELGSEIPWHTRRANVLVEGLRLSEMIGRTIRFGSVEVRLLGETQPCALMDELHPGLWLVLKPDCRAGVHGEVLRGGEFAVGDTIDELNELDEAALPVARTSAVDLSHRD